MEIERVLEALASVRCPAVCEESDLHALIGAALTEAGIPVRHEVRLAPRCRIDFMAEDIGIEVKKSRPSPAALREQLERYAASEEVSALVAVVSRGVALPKTIGGKPVRQVPLERLWGIFLP